MKKRRRTKQTNLGIDRYVLTDGNYIYYIVVLCGCVMTTTNVIEAVHFPDSKSAIKERDLVFKNFEIWYSVTTIIL